MFYKIGCYVPSACALDIFVCIGSYFVGLWMFADLKITKFQGVWLLGDVCIYRIETLQALHTKSSWRHVHWKVCSF